MKSDSEINQQERCDLWYTVKRDLIEFKNDDQAAIARYDPRTASAAPPKQFAPPKNTENDKIENDEQYTRGLEHRILEERQRNKCLVLKAILKAQHKYRDPDILAIISVKCTAWAKEVALCTGYKDFYRAYNPSMLHLVPQPQTAIFPLVLKKMPENSSNNSNNQLAREESTTNRPRRTMSQVAIKSRASIKPVVFNRQMYK